MSMCSNGGISELHVLGGLLWVAREVSRTVAGIIGVRSHGYWSSATEYSHVEKLGVDEPNEDEGLKGIAGSQEISGTKGGTLCR